MTSKARFMFFDVGQGDATLLIMPEGECMLIDNKGGGKVDVREFLKEILPTKNGKPYLNYFVLTHAHADHVGSVNELFDDFEINEVWYTGFDFKGKEEDDLCEQYKQFLEIIEARKEKHEDKELSLESAKPIVISIGDVIFEILSPPSREIWDELQEEKDLKEYMQKLNEYVKKSEDKELGNLIHIGSVVMRITYKSSSVMITGDSELLSWKYWIVPNFSDYCASELLHASHHGSKGFFISDADCEKDESFDENTPGCYTEGLLKIDPAAVVITNNTKPGEKEHKSPPNEHAIKLYKTFKETDREVLFTSDGSIEYILPDAEFSFYGSDIKNKFKIKLEEQEIAYGKHRDSSVLPINKFG